MKALMTPLAELAEYEEAMGLLKEDDSCVSFTGCPDSQKLHLINGLGANWPYRIIVTYSDIRAREICGEYAFYDKDTVYYPAKDLIFYQADIHGNQLNTERMKALRRMIEGKPLTLVTTYAALMSPQVPLELIANSVIRLERLDSLDIDELSEQLISMGYARNYQAEEPGQFSVRGGIVDIFDLTEENPIRVELWGDEIDSIRRFDPQTQRSLENLTAVEIYPVTEMVMDKKLLKKGLEAIKKDTDKWVKKFRSDFKTEEAARLQKAYKQLEEELVELGLATNTESYIRYFYEDTESLIRFFPPKLTCFFLEEPGRLIEHADAVELEFRESMGQRLQKGYVLPGQADLLYGRERTASFLGEYRTVQLAQLDTKGSVKKPKKRFDLTVRTMTPYNSSFESLIDDLKKYRKNGYRILLLTASRTRAKRLAQDLLDEDIISFYSEDGDRTIGEGEVMVCAGAVRRGFEYPLIRFAVITETDIFGTRKPSRKKKQAKTGGQHIASFEDLKVGDYVVHETHGLGVYRGIEKVEMNGVVKDYMKISYRDGGNLYVLATGLDVIQKYASSDAEKLPKLNKLGTQEWTNTKTKVRQAVGEVAHELVELYAARMKKQGYAFTLDTVWQREFEEMFPYEETEDQLSAILATKEDMESSGIMDRLVCGDVGYGKTEIAIRAAFKAVQDGKQVAFLVPTTILAQQHYNTFVQRMKDFPVRIDLLSRFRTASEIKQSVTDLKKGQVDILIGTHRILSKDVQFKDLGLLIVDEEQRFGVTHKEKIKQMKDDVDVLTLTATPIPRTLHMSLIGIRDMSVLEEPPQDRQPIQTYVMEYNEELVREAINRELARGGQIYYVYNRVNTIADMAAALQQLVPEANVAFAHGQMKEKELESIMEEFIEGEIDVLVSTTIVETGLDISNVNTIIIHDADRLGLSQLYQLRGRVGRSNRTAYAFLMYKRDKMLKEIAEKRLAAIREFTELGSGYRIAMRDLEIRGAGNLLGKAQSGHMEAVGYDLYCKMLNEAVGLLKGEKQTADFNTAVELEADAYIPPNYILNEQQKLEIYKRIAGVETKSEAEDMKEELEDRFGQIPTCVTNLLRIALIRARAHALYVTELRGKNGELKLQILPEANLRAENLPQLLNRYGKRLDFSHKQTPYLLLRYRKSGLIERDAEDLLVLTEKLLSDMELLLADIPEA